MFYYIFNKQIITEIEMSTPYTPNVIAARNVQDGKTVYLTTCDAWTPDIEVAEFLAEEDKDWRLAFAQRLREVTGATLTLPPADALQAAVA